MKLTDIKTDCRHFKGDIPCRPHKRVGVHCVEEDGADCRYYDKTDMKILIIKLGAIGDVIRSTPLITKYRAEYPGAKIFWLTETPLIVKDNVDTVLKYNAFSIEYLKNIDFDIAVCLDKDKEACALMTEIRAEKKFGFILKEGMPYPQNELAEHKFLTGIFDNLNKANTKSYLEEIFEICGFEFNGEKYILPDFPEYDLLWNIDKTKKVIGLNTGCGARWTSRLWPDEYWLTLIKTLVKADYEVILLGGELEHEKNLKLSDESGARYFGHFSLDKFINLVSQTDLVVTAVTMTMHITLALEKKIVLFNNIFNPNEFELYGLGELLEPSKECKCFFSQKCTNDEYNCMEHLEPERVFDTIKKLLA